MQTEQKEMNYAKRSSKHRENNVFGDEVIKKIIENLESLTTILNSVVNGKYSLNTGFVKYGFNIRKARDIMYIARNMESDGGRMINHSRTIEDSMLSNYEYFYSKIFGCNDESLYGLMPSDYTETVDVILNDTSGKYGLTPREQEILRKHILEEKSLEEVAKDYGVTRERIRQITEKGIRKLRNPSRIDLVTLGIENYNKRLATIKQAKDAKLEELWAQEGERMAEFEHGVTKFQNIMDASVYDFEFSVRTVNALVRSGIETIGQLAEVGYTRLKRIRNLGAKSIDEIYDKMTALGIRANFMGAYEERNEKCD